MFISGLLRFLFLIEKPIILINSLLLKCTPIDSDSQIPDSVVFNTEARFSSITCEDNDILKIIRNLDISKAHGFDDISIRMVKLCDDSLVKPLSIIFQKCINSGVFPDSWKKSNSVPIYKKNVKQLVSNYRPVSLLPICSKIFERISVWISTRRLLWVSAIINCSQDICQFLPKLSIWSELLFSWHPKGFW